MKLVHTPLPGVLHLEPEVFGDERGSFTETYRAQTFQLAGIDYVFVQDNLSVSSRGVLRGLHLQHPNGQAKLVYVVYGEVFDVCVDVRIGSPTFGQWHGEVLTAQSAHQLMIPPGFAHGFCTLSERAHFAYKCSAQYDPDSQISIAWNDPDIGIAWPVVEPILAPKDAAGRPLRELQERLPRYEGP